MDLTYGAEYEKFRNEVRTFIESHRSQAPDGAGMRAEKNRAWQKMLIERGYTARTIPREYGGHGGEMDILKSRIIAEEFAQAQVPGGLGGQAFRCSYRRCSRWARKNRSASSSRRRCAAK
jgi:alkylation response protein AidB-like acyl-CoA dehydrogenase